MIPPNAVFENVSITLRRVAQCALLGLCLATSLLSQAEAVALPHLHRHPHGGRPPPRLPALCHRAGVGSPWLDRQFPDPGL